MDKFGLFTAPREGRSQRGEEKSAMGQVVHRFSHNVEKLSGIFHNKVEKI